MNITFVYDNNVYFDYFDDLEKGLAGTEGAIVRFSKALAALGHKIKVYNHCKYPGVYNGIKWINIKDGNLDEEIADIIIFVKYVPVYIQLKGKLKCVMLTDRVIPPLLKDWIKLKKIDFIISTSHWQFQCAQKQIGVYDKDIWFNTGLAVNLSDYTKCSISKEDDLCVYTSVPYRGLDILLDMWPEIKKWCPNSRLELVSSYMVWGDSKDENLIKSRRYYNSARALEELDVKNIIEIEKKNKSLGFQRMLEIQKRSKLFLYPSTYDDSFCVTALEAAAAGSVIITSNRAALKERVVDGYTGYLIEGDPYSPEYQKDFIIKTVKLLNDNELWNYMSKNSIEFAKKNDINYLAKKWIQEFKSRLTNKYVVRSREKENRV
ncbi:TPA: glycosyltransferase family 4 protein [Bacillus thuringiensis]|nr:glycosyltransferase family 4 protein [Bacillus thuringiensis]